MTFDAMTIFSFISAIFLFIGSFLCISGGVGILRFPDFYTRIHAVGVTDTLAAAMILLGLILQSPNSLVLIKLLIILVVTLFINPTASHALAKTAIHNGLMPMVIKHDHDKMIIAKKEGKSSNRS
ncbi:multisubunit sodium/proton antiporter, MrpG subunit [Shewanella psychrophila]|uniref:Multisubunit sodium/proton antiporter, MrpG subunit n=1 Tax=Shewanella psychrophila TaxID=225848 RepID=A0A1S6HJJ4_9GAMM|nr:monovalent cation/H(+) antiporter subunit G [Shewanella psychrophila]AQS35692.1 multisubunit sodium/proton antiporter, MrpG subunit [Shewanella psychrophila]